MAFAPLGELQSTLLAAGAAVVVAVWGYNKWQEFRLRQKAARVFRGEHADLLSDKTENDSPPQVRSEDRIEPVFSLPTTDQDVQPLPPALPPLELADSAIDCLVSLEIAQPLAAPEFWAAQGKLFGSLEVRWIGFAGGQWRQLTAHDAEHYRRLTAVLQLADRGGPLGEAALSKFFFGIGKLAEDFQAMTELPEAQAVLDHARSLDEFCAGVDWRIGINVVSRTGKALTAPGLRRLAGAAELRLRDDGMFHAEDENGQTLFTLASLGGLPVAEDADEVAGVTLSIDVPLVSDGVAAFNRLLAFARELMAAENGALVDDQRAPLNETVLDAIRAKIVEFQEKMAALDIPAGGRRAMRLYS